MKYLGATLDLELLSINRKLELGLNVPDKFLATLKARKIYDVNSKKATTMAPGFIPLAATSQPAVVSDQGNNETCASHAVGKAVVEIIDGLGMDCDQD